MKNIKSRIVRLTKSAAKRLAITLIIGTAFIGVWEYVEPTVMAYFPEAEVVEYQRATSTPIVLEGSEKRIRELMKTEDGEKVLRVWAEKKYIEEQEEAINVRKERIMREEASLE